MRQPRQNSSSSDKEPMPVFDCIFCADDRYASHIAHETCLVKKYAGTMDWLEHRAVLAAFRSIDA